MYLVRGIERSPVRVKSVKQASVQTARQVQLVIKRRVSVMIAVLVLSVVAVYCAIKRLVHASLLNAHPAQMRVIALMAATAFDM